VPIKGYVEYKRREFCKDTKCVVQIQLDAQKPDTAEYEKIRQICKEKCVHTTYEFHHWLIQKGYLIVKPEMKK
jgi:Iap family predicted aminopeptidase